MKIEELKIVRGNLMQHPKENVEIFIAYLSALMTEKNKGGDLKAKWIPYATPQSLVGIFNHVATMTGLFIDGDSVTITFRGKLMANFDYKAYKNRILSSYPEAVFDFQIVHDLDTTSFRKVDGKVLYEHIIGDPFNTEKKIIGGYGVLKTRRGEFFEVLTLVDIEKMKAIAKTKDIWEAWFDRMVLKSIIKRICNAHLSDIVKDIEALDNENYELQNVNVELSLNKAVEGCETIFDLESVWDKKRTSKNESDLIRLITERRKEIIDQLPLLTTAELPKALKMLKDGKTPQYIEKIYKIEDVDIINQLNQAAV